MPNTDERILNVLKNWIDKHGYDFVEDRLLVKRLQTLIKLMAKQMPTLCEQMKAMVDRLVSFLYFFLCERERV